MSERLTWVFLVAAGVEVAGLFLDRPLVPFAGTVALLTLLLIVGRRRPVTVTDRRAWRFTLAGLAALVVAAGLADARGGVIGLPDGTLAARAAADLWEIALLAAGCSALAAALLCRVALPRRLMLWSALVSVPAVVWFAVSFAAAPDPQPWQEAAGPLTRTVVLALPAAAVLLLPAAAVATLSARQWAGLALLPLLALGAGVLPAAAVHNELLNPRATAASEPAIGGWTWIPPRRRAELTNLQAYRTEVAARAAREADRRRAVPPGFADVPGPPRWTAPQWAVPDGSRSLPALWVALILLCAAVLPMSIFPPGVRRPRAILPGAGLSPIVRKAVDAAAGVLGPRPILNRADGLLTGGFLILAGVEVAGLILGRRLIPYAGMLALLTLLSWVLLRPPGRRRWARRWTVTGLGAFAVAAGLAFHRGEVLARPSSLPTTDADTGVTVAELLGVTAVLLGVAGCVAFGAAILCRSGRLWSRAMLPTGLFAVYAVVNAAVVMRSDPTDPGEPSAVDPRTMAFLAVATILTVAVANAALTGRGVARLAAPMLVPMLFLSFAAWPQPGATAEALGSWLKPEKQNELAVLHVDAPEDTSFALPRNFNEVSARSALLALAVRADITEFVNLQAVQMPVAEPLPPTWDEIFLGRVRSAADEMFPAYDAGPDGWSRSGSGIWVTFLFLGLVGAVTALFPLGDAE